MITAFWQLHLLLKWAKAHKSIYAEWIRYHAPLQPTPDRHNALEHAGNSTRLLAALANEDWDEVRMLVAHGADVNRVDEHGQTPLHVSLHLPNVPVDVVAVLTSHSNVNMPVSIAVKEEEDIGTLKLAVHVHANDSVTVRRTINKPFTQSVIKPVHRLPSNRALNSTPISLASHVGRYDLVATLVQHGADLSSAQVGPYLCSKLLHWALSQQQVPANIVLKLASINSTHEQEACLSTAVHAALRQRDPGLLKLLLGRGDGATVALDLVLTAFTARCFHPACFAVLLQYFPAPVHVLDCVCVKVEVVSGNRYSWSLRMKQLNPDHSDRCGDHCISDHVDLPWVQTVEIPLLDDMTTIHTTLTCLCILLGRICTVMPRFSGVSLKTNSFIPNIRDVNEMLATINANLITGPRTLVTSCVLVIRQNVKVKSKENFRKLGLPSRLLSCVMLGPLSDELGALRLY